MASSFLANEVTVAFSVNNFNDELSDITTMHAKPIWLVRIRNEEGRVSGIQLFRFHIVCFFSVNKSLVNSTWFPLCFLTLDNRIRYSSSKS